MHLTVTAPPPTHAMPHVELVTVGIEPMDPAMRNIGPAYLRNARIAVMVRAGTYSSILCTDNDPGRHAALEDVAKAYAHEFAALLLAARYPACPWCGRPESPDLDRCPEPDEHRYLSAQSETSWRTPVSATAPAEDLTVWSPR